MHIACVHGLHASQPQRRNAACKANFSPSLPRTRGGQRSRSIRLGIGWSGLSCTSLSRGDSKQFKSCVTHGQRNSSNVCCCFLRIFFPLCARVENAFSANTKRLVSERDSGRQDGEPSPFTASLPTQTANLGPGTRRPGPEKMSPAKDTNRHRKERHNGRPECVRTRFALTLSRRRTC